MSAHEMTVTVIATELIDALKRDGLVKDDVNALGKRSSDYVRELANLLKR